MPLHDALVASSVKSTCLPLFLSPPGLQPQHRVLRATLRCAGGQFRGVHHRALGWVNWLVTCFKPIYLYKPTRWSTSSSTHVGDLLSFYSRDLLSWWATTQWSTSLSTRVSDLVILFFRLAFLLGDNTVEHVIQHSGGSLLVLHLTHTCLAHTAGRPGHMCLLHRSAAAYHAPHQQRLA